MDDFRRNFKNTFFNKDRSMFKLIIHEYKNGDVDAFKLNTYLLCSFVLTEHLAFAKLNFINDHPEIKKLDESEEFKKVMKQVMDGIVGVLKSFCARYDENDDIPLDIYKAFRDVILMIADVELSKLYFKKICNDIVVDEKKMDEFNEMFKTGC